MKKRKMLPSSLIDLSCLEEYTDGDPEAMQELIEVFFETAEESLNELQNNIVDGESTNWSAASHKLKGAAGYIGAENLKTLCASAQNMNVASQQERSDMLEQIKKQYADICTILKEQIG